MPIQQAYQHQRTRRPGAVDVGILSALTYNSQVLTSAPWGYWPMGESSGTTLADISGNGRDASLFGTPTLGQLGWPGEGTSVLFPGNVSHYVFITSTSGLTSTDNFTWEALVAYTSGDGAVVSRGAGASQQLHAMEIVNATSMGHFNWDSTYYVTVPSVANAWHHMAITWNGATRRVYLDGVEQGTGSSYASANWANTPIYIGRTAGTGLPFNGKIQKVAYYTRALSAAELLVHYQALGPA